MIAGLLATLLIAWLVGGLVMAAAWPVPRCGQGAAKLVRIALAGGLGLGLSSAAFVVAIDAGRPSRTAAVAADLILLVGAAASWLVLRRGWTAPALVRGPDPPWRTLDSALGLGVLLLATLALAIAALKAVGYPHGESDAWAIWNAKARLMVRGGAGWRTALASLTHADYPLLLPGAVARIWTYLKSETWLAPVAVGGAFTAATVTAASALLWLRRSRRHGLVTATLLLGSPYLIDYGLVQTADVPMGFYLLAALGLLTLADQPPAVSRARLVALAGLALGLAAWTKNEGLLYLLCATGAHGLVTGRRSGLRAAATEMGQLIAGAAPLLAVLAYHRTTVPLGWFVQRQTADALAARVLAPERYAVVGEGLLRAGLDLGGWSVSVLALLLLCSLVWGVRVEPADRVGASRTALTVVSALLGVLTVYVVTPLPLRWQIGTSLPRLLTQLWPSVVLLFGLVVRAPASPDDPAPIAPSAGIVANAGAGAPRD